MDRSRIYKGRGKRWKRTLTLCLAAVLALTVFTGCSRKTAAATGSRTVDKEYTRDIYEEFRDQAKMACAGDMWMDCMARDVNKGRAVRTIQESLGIKVEETMAFGDQLNDIEMLNQAYYSFAVANAREEVRRAARFQADSNVRGGVLKILKGLL